MHISDDEFERAIEQVLDDLPERFARVLENVGIVVADEPNERELATMSNPCGEPVSYTHLTLPTNSRV